MARLRELVKDHQVLDLVERVIADGVQIGVYCSQWFANTTLQPLDHLIREGGFGVKHYLRYMDNFTIFSSNKRKLRKLFYAIQKWLAEHNLGIKDNWQIYLTSTTRSTWLSFWAWLYAVEEAQSFEIEAAAKQILLQKAPPQTDFNALCLWVVIQAWTA